MTPKEFGQNAWDNWWDNKGPCADCPNRDEDGYFCPKNIDPGLNSGSVPVSVMLVAEAPNDKHPGDDPEDVSSDESRKRKNFNANHWNERERSLIAEKQNNPSASGFLNDEIPDVFFEELNCEWDDGLYYTNVKKCADIHPREGDNEDANKIARDRCRDYLETQLDVLEPDVIITIGDTARTTICDVLGIDKGASISSMIPGMYDRQAPIVVPSYHWSFWRPNVSQYLEMEMGDYWPKIAETANNALEKVQK